MLEFDEFSSSGRSTCYCYNHQPPSNLIEHLLPLPIQISENMPRIKQSDTEQKAAKARSQAKWRSHVSRSDTSNQAVEVPTSSSSSSAIKPEGPGSYTGVYRLQSTDLKLDPDQQESNLLESVEEVPNPNLDSLSQQAPSRKPSSRLHSTEQAPSRKPSSPLQSKEAEPSQRYLSSSQQQSPNLSTYNNLIYYNDIDLGLSEGRLSEGESI